MRWADLIIFLLEKAVRLLCFIVSVRAQIKGLRLSIALLGSMCGQNSSQCRSLWIFFIFAMQLERKTSAHNRDLRLSYTLMLSRQL